MRTIKLIIGFEGTRYEGWQSQRKNPSASSGQSRTVQEIFEKILAKLLKEKTNLISSSRTDSGVHAEAIAAHFRTKNPLPDGKIKDALNFFLPRDIVVHSAAAVSPQFHARYSARSKLYRYAIWNSPTRPLFEAPFVLWFPRRLDVSSMKKAARHFIGRHDFTAFRDRGEDEKSAVRTVKRLRIGRVSAHGHAPLLRIEIEADGFLRHMVRVIVGTLVEVGRGKMRPEAIPKILRSRDRSQAGPTAKALGLTLVKVRY